MLYTDGIKALCENYSCYWLLDLVASYQPGLRSKEFQAWRLKKFEDKSALVTCTDGNSKVLKGQEVPYSDFSAIEVTTWVEGNVVLLPSEH